MKKYMKRPMLKKGGSAGIMSNVTERQGYSIGDRVLERQKLLSKFASPSRSTALPNFLIQSGLNLIEGTGRDTSTIREIGAAVRDPLKTAMAAKEKEDMFKRQLGLTAATGVIGEQQAMKLAREKSRFGKPTNYQTMLNTELVSQFGRKNQYSQEEIKSANQAVQKFMKLGTTNYADDLSKTAKTYEDTPNPSYSASVALKHEDRVTILTDAFYDLKEGTLDEEKLKKIGRPGVVYYDSGSMKFLQVVKDPNTNMRQIVEVQEPATQ